MVSPRSRRGLYITLAAILILNFFFLPSSFHTGSLRHIIPFKSGDHESNVASGAPENTASPHQVDSSAPYATAGSDDEQVGDGKDLDSQQANHATDPSSSRFEGNDQEYDDDDVDEKPKGFVHSGKPDAVTGQLHFLIPADHSTVKLCYNLVSAAANRWPAPILMGWNGKGQMSAKKTHLAKLRAIQRYLDALPAASDNDLVLVIDGYDVLMQLPPEVVIERYFEVREKEDAKMAERMGVSVEEAHKRGYRQTIFWGPDKICWPIDWNAPRCWAVPASGLPKGSWGPNPDDGQMWNNDPKWLNSGTVIGPIGDYRDLIHDTMIEINQTYSGTFYAKDSDQFYLANVWGRQEYYRTRGFSQDGSVPERTGQRREPKMRGPEHAYQTEFHVSLDYESAMFQPKAGSEAHFGFAEYDKPGMNATAKMDPSKGGLPGAQAQDIHMPDRVQKSLARLYDAIPGAHPGSSSQDWLPKVSLGTNWVTRNIYAMWHCTGDKKSLPEQYTRFWWFPFASSLVRANVAATKGTHVIGDGEQFDGRKWKGVNAYPETGEDDDLGGAWTDEGEGAFVGLQALCGSFYDSDLFPSDKVEEAEGSDDGLALDDDPEELVTDDED